VERILGLRTRYPRWGKDKLVVLLQREGIRVSTSTAGQVLKRLKDREVLVEPLNVRLAKAARKRRWKPRYAMRKPAGYRVDAPGDLVQVDTLQIRLQTTSPINRLPSSPQMNIIETGLNAIRLPGITNVLDEYMGLTMFAISGKMMPIVAGME